MVFLAIYRLLSSISSILNILQYFIKKKKILNFEERQIIILINNFLLLYSVKKNLTSINPIYEKYKNKKNTANKFEKTRPTAPLLFPYRGYKKRDRRK